MTRFYLLPVLMLIYGASYSQPNQAQTSKKQEATTYKLKLKEHIIPVSLMLLSGASDGLRDAVLFKNDRVLTKLKVNQHWWGPESWKNKYKNGDPLQGAKFPGSTSLFVFVTDANHFFKFTNNLFTAGTIAIKIGQQRKKWWVYIVEGLAYWGVNRVGFYLTYNYF